MDHISEYRRWLADSPLTAEEKAALSAMENDENEIKASFNGLLSFGTAGLRGIMGMGTSRMNRYVIRHATQALADVMLASSPDAAARGIAVCHDCRNHGREFAVDAACVAAANGIHVYIFEDMRPTPELSFAVRRYRCAAGINVTASHNTKEYNGYKVYWSDGAQLPPARAAEVAKRMSELDIFASPKYMEFDEAVKAGLITVMGRETDDEFIACALGERLDWDVMRQARATFRMVYTPFHGTGRELIPKALHYMGVEHLFCEEKQMVPDGDFSTVKSPNPEYDEGFYLCRELADRENADLILGSDPDADRVGVLARDKSGEFMPITGNQMGALLFDYVVNTRRRMGKMPAKPVVLKSIVSTELVRAIAEKNGVACYDTFTGFKFIAEKKDKLEAAKEGNVIFAFEESYGYMSGNFVRDKDAVTASVLITEMAAWYHTRGMTLIDALEELYGKYGRICDSTVNLVMPGLDGAEKMKALMTSLRREPPREIAGTAVSVFCDYLSGRQTAADGTESETELAGADMVSFLMTDGTKVIVRPSGTEPKLKIYIMGSKSDAERYSRWANTLAE